MRRYFQPKIWQHFEINIAHDKVMKETMSLVQLKDSLNGSCRKLRTRENSSFPPLLGNI